MSPVDEPPGGDTPADGTSDGDTPGDPPGGGAPGGGVSGADTSGGSTDDMPFDIAEMLRSDRLLGGLAERRPGSFEAAQDDGPAFELLAALAADVDDRPLPAERSDGRWRRRRVAVTAGLTAVVLASSGVAAAATDILGPLGRLAGVTDQSPVARHTVVDPSRSPDAGHDVARGPRSRPEASPSRTVRPERTHTPTPGQGHRQGHDQGHGQGHVQEREHGQGHGRERLQSGIEPVNPTPRTTTPAPDSAHRSSAPHPSRGASGPPGTPSAIPTVDPTAEITPVSGGASSPTSASDAPS